MEADSLVLGRIKSVSKFYLELCLPHGRVGRVNIYDVSDKYTEILKEIISSGDSNKNVASLDQLFKVGQFVRGCMKNNAFGTGGGDHAQSKGWAPTEVSLNPKLVNKGLLRKRISLNCWLVGAVVTEEDHGFTIDIGVSDMECFLPKSHVQGNCFDNFLMPLGNVNLGQLITVAPISSDSMNFAAAKDVRVLTVSALREDIESVMNPLQSIHFCTLLPGVWLRGTINGKIKSTLVVKFCDYLISVSRAHYMGDNEDYAQNKEVVVCLLVVDPGTKQLTGSLLPHLLPPSCPEYVPSLSCDTISIGSKFPSAVVTRVDKRTVHVQLESEDGIQGVIRKTHVPEKLKCDNLKAKFSVGQKINCRVIDYDLLENVALATMKKKLLRLPYLSISEVSPGDKVNVLTVDTTSNKMILTAKRGLVEATCPIIGSKEMVDALADAKFLRNLGDQLYAAFVAKICEHGLLLIGVNGMRAWLPKMECGLSEDDALEATYFRGQVLRVRIVRRFKPSTDSIQKSELLVSLKLKESEETVQKDRTPQQKCSFSVGQIFDVKVHKVVKSGIIVDLLSATDPENGKSGLQTVGVGFLRFDQLTDHETNVPLLTNCLSNAKPGKRLELDGNTARQVVMICKTAKAVLVSAKPTLVRAAKECQQTVSDKTDGSVSRSTGFLREFSELRVGSQWFASVQNHVDYGIFVNFPSAIRGLAPVRLLSDTHIPPKVSMTDLFPPGATVIAKVVEVAPSTKRRCLVSLRMMDTYVAEEHYVNGAIQSLHSWMTEQEWISRSQNALSMYRIGDLVSFQITDSDALIAVGEACKQTQGQIASHSASRKNKNSWVSALVYRENAEGMECRPGELYNAVVTFVDFAASRLELALSSWLLNSINHRDDEKDACTLRLGQKVSCVTVAVRQKDVAVVAFRGHAAGRFGLVPARRTFNDVVGGNAWVLGQRNQVTLRTPFKQQDPSPILYFCTLSIYDPVTAAVDSHTVRSKHGFALVESSAPHWSLAPEKTDVDVDDVVCGRLLRVSRDHWTLRLPGDTVGRLHVTAMVYAKYPQPIDLESSSAAHVIIHRGKTLGTNLAKNRLITCRVVDKVEHGDSQCTGQPSSPLYYVCTNPAVLNGGIKFWKDREPEFGRVTDAFVKTRSPHGLLVSITHMDDMMIPIGPALCARLRKAQIGFRVGDHLLVRPLKIFENQLIGELVLEGELSGLDEGESQSVTTALIEHIAIKTDQTRKRMERIKQSLSSLKFVEMTPPGVKRDASGQVTAELSPGGKKSRLAAVVDAVQSEDDAVSTAVKRRRSESSELFDPEIVERYADFMLPVEYDCSDTTEPVRQINVDDQTIDNADKLPQVDAATAEYRLHETEQRKAVLAALTTAQPCLPKGLMRPSTTEEFELTVRNAPSNSACWTAYMTHILAGNSGPTALSEARTIAERGLRAIGSMPDLEPGEQEMQQARLLLFYLIMEAKELERCTQQKETHTLYHLGTDPALELNDQANRVSQVLSRLVNLDQAEFTRRAIETMADIGQFERAEDLARRLIKSCPLDVDRWLSLIKVRFRAGRVAAAREAQRNAVGIVRSTQLPRLLTSAARLEFEFGDVDRSLSLLREQLSAHPKQHLIYEELIKILFLAGKKSEARCVEEQAKERVKPHEYEAIHNLFQSELMKHSNV
ncbi:rRNA biogenesis protein RRP5 [Fasciola hepatica]|uniref:rRNA biogenesis protein RRP5 n=1 Tax=Fasciola hepatica TaxID=6192 RepID=A0A4E0R3L0_FASHE|nr:rRNA biogenesis protein RRP5 [Fasciola hepatica]